MTPDRVLSLIPPDAKKVGLVGAAISDSQTSASAQLRRDILKGTVERHLLRTGEIAGGLGLMSYKVDMRVWLPNETEADIDELIQFTLELRKVTGRTRVALGIAPFVAKRNTPLDRAPYAGIKAVNRSLKRLTRGLRGKVEVRPTSVCWAWVEYVVAQGTREAGLAILDALHEGATFADYKRAFVAHGIA